MKELDIKARISVQVLKDRQTGQFVAYSPMLDLSSCGRTPSAAIESFAEAASLFLAELKAKGDLDEVLAELGWRKVNRPTIHWIPPEILAQQQWRSPRS